MHPFSREALEVRLLGHAGIALVGAAQADPTGVSSSGGAIPSKALSFLPKEEKGRKRRKGGHIYMISVC